MSTKKMDWKLGGQMFAMLVKFFSNITALFKSHEAGPEILDWIDGPGREFFEQKMGEVIHYHKNRFVDGDAEPFCPNNWSVVSHRKMGQVELYPSQIELWLSREQKRGSILGENLLEDIGQFDDVMNANVLDFLLANTYLIPESWEEEKMVLLFCGTVYLNKHNQPCVRGLFWNEDHNYWDSMDWTLSEDWTSHERIARLQKAA